MASPRAAAFRASTAPDEKPNTAADPPGLREQGGEIVDLPVDLVRRRVPAVAAAAAVVGVDRKARRQVGGEGRPGRPIVEGAHHEDDRRPLADPIERDPGPIFREQRVHLNLLFSQVPSA